MTRSGDIRLGQHLIQRKVCTLRQVNEGLEAQRLERAQGVMRPLGWLLIKKGYMNEEMLRGALSEMGRIRALRLVTESALYGKVPFAVAVRSVDRERLDS